MGLKINKFKLIFFVIVSVLFASTVALIFVNLNNKTQEPSRANDELYPKTAAELNSWLHNPIYADATIHLTKNIDLRDVTWTPVGTMNEPFRGKLIGDGGMVTIRDITISPNPNGYNFVGENISRHDRNAMIHKYDGFFGVVYGATIENVRFENVTYNFEFNINNDHGTDANVYFGSICGRSFGNTTIKNCEVRGLTVDVTHMEDSGIYGYYCSGIVGITKSLKNEYDLNKYSIDYNVSSSETIIENVIVENADIKRTGAANSKVTADSNMYFSGITYGSWYLYQTTNSVTVKNAVLWNSHGGPALGDTNYGWVQSSWIEGTNWWRIGPDAYDGNSITKTNSHGYVGEIDGTTNPVLLNLEGLTYTDYHDTVNYTFFYNSTIKYNTWGEWETKGDARTFYPSIALTNDVEYVTTSIDLIDNFDGVSSISGGSEHFQMYHYDIITAPCYVDFDYSAMYGNITIQFASNYIRLTLKTNFNSTQTQESGNNYINYFVTINPNDVPITFEPPTLAGVYMSGNSSNIKLDPTSSITVELNKSGDNYILTYKFYNKTTKNDQAVVYTISHIYYVKSYYNGLTINEGETKELKVQDMGSNTSISPVIQLKQYNINFG